MSRPTVKPWNDIRRDYVEGSPPENDGDRIFLTVEELGRKYDCHQSSIKNKAAREKWVEQRTTFQAQVQLKRMEYRAKELGKRRAAIDERAYALAIKTLNIIARGLEAIEKKTRKPVDALVVARFAGAIVRAQQAAMLATGESVDVSPLARPGGMQPSAPTQPRLVHVVYEKLPPVAERVREYE